MAIDNQRMLDLLRVCRSELFVEHKLIDEKEYSWLASLPSRETHARLADYDKLRTRIAELEAQLAARDAAAESGTRRAVANMRERCAQGVEDVLSNYVTAERMAERIRALNLEPSVALAKAREVKP
jgi:hypothetical protein